ncbi:hypothetical protein DPMN_004389 [Dreissena polymorpha]|uniref:Uncharacterized protein n=1 Tax=Dreissena polymorpha TaxID=45954 RepID=A0A9D4MNE3_DREPO|nr:hypothetical protein DPMN_004389 [Dreissena polymorpha]
MRTVTSWSPRDGTVISKLADPAFQWGYLPPMHVTESRQLLVFGNSTSILQVDRDGRYIVKVVVDLHDGVKSPCSVQCSKLTGSLIIGMLNNNKIIEFKTLPK